MLRSLIETGPPEAAYPSCSCYIIAVKVRLSTGLMLGRGKRGITAYGQLCNIGPAHRPQPTVLDDVPATTDQPLIPLRAAVRACKSATTGSARVGIRLFTGQKGAPARRGLPPRTPRRMGCCPRCSNPSLPPTPGPVVDKLARNLR